MRIRTGDTVMVTAGRDKGKTGRVERQYPRKTKWWLRESISSPNT